MGMSFRVAPSETFWATVRSEFQAENGGRHTITFQMEYRRLSQTALRTFAEKSAEEVTAAADIVEAAVDRIMAIAINWRDVTDEEGNDAPFTRERLRDAVDRFGVGPAIINAFYESMPKAKAKN